MALAPKPKNYKEVLAQPEFSAFWGDLYALTMSQALFTLGVHNTQASFELFIRKAPFGGSYLATNGQNIIAEWLEKYWRFDEADLDIMREEVIIDPATGKSDRLFTDAFIDFVSKEPLRLTINAIQEGDLSFSDEPILDVLGPVWQGLMIETGSLNAVNSQALFTTLTTRLLKATQSDGLYISEKATDQLLYEFGLRRAQCIGGLEPTRAAFVGGAHKTSNMLGRKFYGIPMAGTFAHALVMMAESEVAAFDGYATAMPHNGIFLVDTYNTLEGVKNAIKVCKEKGIKLKGIRLDSGDLAALSIEARKLLDDAGFTETKIAASNDLNEKEILRLKAAGARIDIWAVGTNLVTSQPQPALGAVYKLSRIFGPEVAAKMIELYYKARQSGDNSAQALGVFYRDVIKLGEKPMPGELEKASIPGHKQILRTLFNDNGKWKLNGDILIPADMKLPYKLIENPTGPYEAELTQHIRAEHKDSPTNFREYEAGTKIRLPQKPMFNQGSFIWPNETIHDSRLRCAESMDLLPEENKALANPKPYFVGLMPELAEGRRQQIKEIRTPKP